MPIWKNSRMEFVYYDERVAVEDDTCEVRIDEDLIVVSYEDSDGVVNYKGRIQGQGHYRLCAPERDGQATLHSFEGSKILEGFWIEEGYKGFWRITLR